MGTADEHAVTRDSQSNHRIRTTHHEHNVWVDVTDPTQADFDELERSYQLHPVHLRESVERVLHTQIEREEQYLFLVLHLPVYDASSDRIYDQQLSVFLGHHFLITVHRDASEVIDALLQAAQQHEDKRRSYFSKGPGELLYLLIKQILDQLLQFEDSINSELDEIEFLVFDNNASDAQRIGKVRQQIVRLDRIMAPLKSVLADLAQHIHSFTGENLTHQYANNAKTAGSLWETVAEAKETIEIYKDADFTTSTEQTNRILAVLTLIFTFTIPITVVGTVYGMNIPVPGGIEVGAWTFLGRYTTLEILIIVSMLFAIGMYWYFRHKKWF